MEKQEMSMARRISKWLRRSLAIKLLSIGFLVLLLMIPNGMVQDLIRERQYNQSDAIREVSRAWGPSQQVVGPVLTIPYSEWMINDKGEKVEYLSTAYFLPLKLDVDGKLNHQTRKRGIFDIVLFQSNMTLSGKFEKPDFKSLRVDEKDVHWDEAKLSIGISGMEGIKELIKVDWSGQEFRSESGTAVPHLIKAGVNVEVPINAEQKEYAFKIPIKINGSEFLHIEPVGKETNVNLSSEWPSPSFDGKFMPDTREVTEGGFNAQWQILDLNRGYPQQWKKDKYNIGDSSFGVRLIQPVDEYAKNTRSAKYALLVIGLTFLIYFFFETLKRFDIHPFQYFLIGLALIVFYLLLLSLSEQIGFNLAYLVASVATVSLITGYSGAFLKNRGLTIQLGLLLSGIYGFIFVVLQLEDYALLAGSVGIFVALAAVMFYSRRVDWYALGE